MIRCNLVEADAEKHVDDHLLGRRVRTRRAIANALQQQLIAIELLRTIEDGLPPNVTVITSGDPFDLILCNPPFHQGHVIGDHIAWQMFAQSKKQLRKDGELWIVGNRHLQYHIKLKKIFGNCRQVAGNAKFVMLAASA